MTLARIEMVLRLVGGAIAALGFSEFTRVALTPTPALLAPWPYLLTVIIAIGGVALFIARNYQFGSSLRMGPGYFPVILSAALVIFGVYFVLHGLPPRR